MYGGLSQTALYYIGGILKHAHALNAFTNASTNSYKRLVKGFEAPTLLAYSARNRSASMRIPHVPNPKGRRIEVRFPDSTANPYFAFTAILMAGLDGIAEQDQPGPAAGQGSLRPAARGREADSDGVVLAAAVAGGARQGSRLPDGRRRAQRLDDRCVHRAEGAGDHPVRDDAASRRVRDVLQPLIEPGAPRPVLSNRERGGVLRIPPVIWHEEPLGAKLGACVSG